MDKLVAIRIKYDDQTYSEQIPVSVLAENVQWDESNTLIDILGNINLTYKGNIQDQIDELNNRISQEAYSKPIDGIPKADLADSVKISLGKADTALQSYTETDPTVPAWAKQPNKPTYTAQEVGALPADSQITVEVDDTLSIQGAAADAKKVGDELTQIKQDLEIQQSRAETAQALKINKPITNPNGTNGQILQTDGQGGTVWVNKQTDEQIANAVTDWLDDHVVPGASTIVVDDTLSISGAAADAKKTGDEITSLKEDYSDIDDRVTALEDYGGGISMTAVNLLDTILSEAVYGTDQTANIALLKNELSKIPPISISAVLDGTALEGQNYSELDFIVTATFDDESTVVVDDYTLVTTGTVVAGSNTVTIRYRGITTTCTFIAEEVTTYSITYNLSNVTSSNTATVVVEDSYYSTVLSVSQDYGFNGCTVTMGGVDVTSTVYSNMEILITQVTGDVVITASATQNTYLDDLTITRTNGNCEMYSDNLITRVAGIGRGTATYGVTEYPAKNNCTITYTITNNSGSDIALDGTLGFGMINPDGMDLINHSNNRLKIPYWTIASNSSGTLADGESIMGTINLLAGYQLIMTAKNLATYQALTVTLLGVFVPDEFSGYSTLTVSKSSSNYGNYRTISFYSDSGETLIVSKASNAFKLITDTISAGTYDVYAEVKGNYDVSHIGDNPFVFGAVVDNTSTQSNYAWGRTDSLEPNVWYHGQITVSDAGMTLTGYTYYLEDNMSIVIRIKEVTA